jgi:transposase
MPPCPTLRRRAAVSGVSLSPSHLSRPLAKLGLRLKKSLIAVERDEAARTAWGTAMADVNPAMPVFLDETSTPATLTPLRARAARGQRAHGPIPRRRREAISWLATLTVHGLDDSLLVQGAVDRLVFESFVERVLVPTLCPGQFVNLDHRSVHRSATARARIEAAGYHLAFLPSYSPDMNPIKQAFAKFKQALRRVGARSFETAVTMALPIIIAADAQAYFADAGLPSGDASQARRSRERTSCASRWSDASDLRHASPRVRLQGNTPRAEGGQS